MEKGIDIPSYLLGVKNGGSIKDVIISPVDITPGVTQIPEGTLYFVYE